MEYWNAINRSRVRPFAQIGTAVVGAALVLVLAAPAAMRRPRIGVSPRESSVIVYRYQFARAARGAIQEAVQREIAFYQERLRHHPDGGLDLALLAGAYLKQARLSGQTHWYLLAEQTAQRSLASLPFNNDGARLILAKVAEVRHDFAEAVHLAGQYPNHPDALAIVVTANLGMGNVDAAIRAAERLVAHHPSLGSFALRAIANLARGHDAAALEDFQHALAAEEPGEHSTSAWVRTLLGRFYLHRGRLDEAADLFAESLRILPSYPLALIYQAELKTRLGAYARAERSYWQALAGSPGESYPMIFDHVAMQGLARVKRLQGDEPGAQALWQKAEAMIRGHLDAFGHRRELARLLLERGDPNDVPEALALVRDEVRTRRDAETLDTLAWALARAGRWHEARQAIRQALATGVQDARLFYRAGVIERALGNPARANAYFRAALKVDSSFDGATRRALGVDEGTRGR